MCDFEMTEADKRRDALNLAINFLNSNSLREGETLTSKAQEIYDFLYPKPVKKTGRPRAKRKYTKRTKVE